MIKEQINYLAISDLHLGHRKNKTINIIKNLDIAFDHYRNRSDLDIIFLVGDVFDDLLECSMSEFHETVLWFTRLILYCERNQIKLRVLEGTPSHDWKQSKIIKLLAGVLAPNADIEYFDTLHIEYLADLDINILYVPDEWHSDPNVTFKQILVKLHELAVTQVDIAMMHGQFSYQLPFKGNKAPQHNENNYLSIVKYYISIGHIHTFSAYERIISQGSFDRLAHGEEGKKGYVLISIYKNGDRNFTFIENKYAKTFLTINVRKKTLEEAIDFITKKTKNLPLDSYIRIKANKDHPILLAFNEIKLKFANFNLTKQDDELATSENYLLINEVAPDDNYIPININADNIEQLVIDNINNKFNLNDKQLLSLRATLRSSL